MSITSHLTISLLVLLATQSLLALGQSNNPWNSPQDAELFIKSFIDEAGLSGAFSFDQMDDMTSIGETLMESMEKMARSGKNTKSRLQALNMAFASSVAEIAVVEDGGASIAVKTNAISDALSQAFLQTTGSVNYQFVNEIQSLINMFSQVNVNEVGGSGASSSASGYGGSDAYGSGRNTYGQQGAGVSVAVSTGVSSGYDAGTGYNAGRGGNDEGQEEPAAAAVAGGAGGDRGYGAGRGGYGAGQGGDSSAAAAAAAAGGAGGDRGYGAGRGRYGAGQGGDSSAAAAAAAGGAGGDQGYGAGRGGYGAGQGGDSSAAAAAAAGVAGGEQGFGTGSSYMGQGAGSAAGAAVGAGGNQGYGAVQGSSAASSVSVSSAASRLSTPEASARVSSAVSVLASSGTSSPGVLSSVIGDVMSQVGSSGSGLSDCDVMVQSLLEVLSALVHILSYSSVGQVDFGAIGSSAQLVSQALAGAMVY